MDTIDLAKLAQALRAVPETKPHEIEKIQLDEYLEEHLLPIFMDDRYPGLNELDYDQFKREDLCDLAAYLQSFGRLEYNLNKLNRPISRAPAKASETRAFL